MIRGMGIPFEKRHKRGKLSTNKEQDKVGTRNKHHPIPKQQSSLNPRKNKINIKLN